MKCSFKIRNNYSSTERGSNVPMYTGNGKIQLQWAAYCIPAFLTCPLTPLPTEEIQLAGATSDPCLSLSSGSFEAMGHLYNNEKDHSTSFTRLLRSWPRLKWDKLFTVILAFGIILTYINLSTLTGILDRVRCRDAPLTEANKTFAVHGKRVDSGYLTHVFDTFYSVGYTRRNVTGKWDVLWSHEYPFRILEQQMKDLKPGQKVNHFPGSGFITNKMNLATTEYRFVPRAFQLPKGKDNLLLYANKNPSTLFVQKSNNHRGIKIEKIENLDLEKGDTFVQTYVANPFLVDGHKFDIGIYVVMTSLEPLRIYKYGGDVLFRFCPVAYHPFDPEILDKYVVGDDYLPLWKVDSLRDAYKQGFSMKEAFDSYVRKKGKDPAKIWKQVDSAIRTIYLTKESSMIESWKKFDKKRNFFELVRFDFVIDEDLAVFLMEVNMSPNLSSSHFPPNRLLYEQVLFGTFSLAGIASHINLGTRNHLSRYVNSKQVTMNYTMCTMCLNCEKECKLCPSCTSEEDYDILYEAYLEHVNKVDFVRVLPHPEQEKSGLTPANKWMAYWFEAKCAMDRTWCN